MSTTRTPAILAARLKGSMDDCNPCPPYKDVAIVSGSDGEAICEILLAHADLVARIEKWQLAESRARSRASILVDALREIINDCDELETAKQIARAALSNELVPMPSISPEEYHRGRS